MPSEALAKGAELISNADKLRDTSITVLAILFIILILFMLLKFYFDSILSKKEVESVAKDNLLEAKIKNIEEKLTAQSKEYSSHYSSFYKILSEIKEKLISKGDLANMMDLRVANHKDNCKTSKKI